MNERQNMLPQIPCGYRPRILLLGNGINRAFDNCSWSEMNKRLSCISLKHEEELLIQNAPYPLQSVIYTNDMVKESITNNIQRDMIDQGVTDDEAKMLRSLVCLPFDSILTTNYTYDIEKALDSSFVCKIGRGSKFRKISYNGDTKQQQFGIYKYMRVADKKIWHIHGEAALAKSIVLGHYHYGKLISTIQQYISKNIRQYKAFDAGDRDITPHSWIDYFMLSDIYVVGLGLDLSEFDLWWLINCKKRHNINDSKIYFFEPDINTKENAVKKLLAKSYNVEIATIEKDKTYIDYYNNLIDTLQKEFEIR